jgi:hypothetical protein
LAEKEKGKGDLYDFGHDRVKEARAQELMAEQELLRLNREAEERLKAEAAEEAAAAEARAAAEEAAAAEARAAAEAAAAAGGAASSDAEGHE